MKLLIVFVVLNIIVIIWAVWGRNWLKQKPWSWSVRFFERIEPIEIVLWKKSETVFKARWMMLMGATLTVLTQAKEIDITPLMPLVPDRYEGILTVAWNMLPMIITVLSAADEKLRNDTSTPLPIVALPDKVIAETPKLAQAVAAAAEAKAEAVAVATTVVAENKAEVVAETAAIAADATKSDKPKDGD